MRTRGLLSYRPARRYLTGQAISLLGDSSMWIACGIWVKTLTGSNAAAGLSFLCFTAPSLLAPLAGLLVDRVRRRTLLLAANLAGAAMLTPLLLVHDGGDVWIIYLVMVLYGTLNILIAPAQSALMSTLLPSELLVSANAALRTVQESLRVLAPLLGAGLFAALGGHAVVALDVVTFLVAAGFIAALPRTEPAPARAATTGQSQLRQLGRELSAGFRFVRDDRVLRQITIGSAVAMLVIGFGESTGFAIVSDGLHRSAEFIGVMQLAQGVGAILSGLVAAATVRRLGEVKVAAAGLALMALGHACMTTAVLGVVLGGKVLIGIGLPWLVIALLTLLQRLAPGHLQGRVFAAFEVATTGPQTLSIGLGAALIASFDYRIVVGIEAAVLVVAALLIARISRRTAEPEPVREPAAVPDPEAVPVPV